MNTPFFADTAAVEFQDAQTLNLLCADSAYAQYHVAGFQQLQVYITDHRTESVLAAQKLVHKGNRKHFLQFFNQPAFILISQAGSTGIMIDLYDAADCLPINTLWVGTCPDEHLPIHNYHFYHYEPAVIRGLAFLSIFQNDPEPVLIPARAREYVNR